jgi:hypothetical protein
MTAALGLAAQAEAAAVSTLASKGATTFIVPLISDLGKAPAVTAVPGLGALATQLSALYNTNLVNDLNAIGGGITIHVLDTFSLTDAIVNDPAGFGLLAELVPGAYFLNPQVRTSLGYHGQGPHPIDPRPDYLDDGLLQSVIGRGPIYRPTPRQQQG